MKTKTKLTLCCLAAALVVTGSAQTVPQLINYQGKLSDAAGVELPTADYRLSFSVYDAAQAGNRVWGPQTLQAIPVVKGNFNVMLGPTDDSQQSIIDAFGAQSRWIEIAVGNNPPIQPRQRILSAPFAIKAGEAENAVSAQNAQTAQNATKLAGSDWSSIFGSNDPINGKIPGNKLADGAVTTDRLAQNAVTTDRIAASAITSDRIQPNAVTTAQIAPGAVQTSDIGDGQVTQEKLATSFLESLVPPGTVIAYAGSQAPNGWLPCDGRPLESNVYPKLFAAITTTWGAGVPNTALNFNLPNFRGMFLRGAGTHGTQKRADGSDFNGGAVGAFQRDEFQGHLHNMNMRVAANTEGGGSVGSGSLSSSQNFRSYFGATSDSIGTLNHGSPRVGNETKPASYSILYIIKH